MNTLCTITYYDDADRDAVIKTLALCKSYEQIFSRTEEDSELFLFNETGALDVSQPLKDVISLALDYCEKTDGAFDITMGGVSSLYDFSGKAPHAPSPADLETALSHVGYRNVSVNGNTVAKADPDAIIDLGAIAKGYIADQMKQNLQDLGVEHAIISLGGNIVCLGGKPDGTDFTVGIRYPEQGSTQTLASIRTAEYSVVTSGIYERFFEENGKTYHHLLDPKTGKPFDNGLLAVSIIGPESIHCDALSTACFALGLEDGIAFINALPDYEAAFVTMDKQLHFSQNFEEYMK